MESQTVNYLDWLYDKVRDDKHKGYYKLLEMLYSVPFYASVKNDVARARDGYLLREYYCDRFKCGYEESSAVRFHLNGESSVLEMMIGLADRCETEIMWDPDKGDRTSVWFWTMVDNLGLGDESDENWGPDSDAKVYHNVDILVGREYFCDGKGGLFPLKHTNKDQRKVEIWYQMQYWLQENFDF